MIKFMVLSFAVGYHQRILHHEEVLNILHNLFGVLSLDGSHLAERVKPASQEVEATGTLTVQAPLLHREDDIVVAARGRPILEGRPLADGDASREIAAAFRREGSAALTRLCGPFAIVVVNISSRTALLAVDRMGREPLSWGVRAGALVWGASARQVAEQLYGSPEVNQQVIYDFMLNHMIPAPGSAYRGVGKLPRGSYVSVSLRRAESGRYWSPTFVPDEAVPLTTLREDVLRTLERAIRAIGVNAGTGTFLSGGLDSSTVTGLLTRIIGREAKAFSVGFGVEAYNELDYARIAVKKFGCQHFEYQVTPDDVVDLIPKIACAYDEPFGNSSAVPTYCCARLAKDHGADRLLAGDGGDELFGGNERYVRQRTFELYRSTPAWFRHFVAEPWAKLFDPETSWYLFRKASSYVRQAMVPLPDRLQSWNMIYREGPLVVFAPDFLAGIDQEHPWKEMREQWSSCSSGELLNRMLWYDWEYTLAASDLPKVSRMCELAGIDVAYPMLDDAFVELSIRVPARQKVSGHELRSFYKDAVRGFLPDDVITKRKHGFGLPFGTWLKTHKALQELVHESLKALGRYGFFNQSFLARMESEHGSGHASYYGYVIWDLVMLEHWLREQPVSGSVARH